jgi:hypothetical protein
MAIVPSDDERVSIYEREFPQFRRFVGKFTDPFGARIAPGILLIRHSAPNIYRSMEAVASFRDLVALSVIPLQRARSFVSISDRMISFEDGTAYLKGMIAYYNSIK